jgi:glycosyltransferase involved in cell wall biosynthesis
MSLITDYSTDLATKLNYANRAIKIQFISGHLAVANTNGSDAYVLDFIKYLRKLGCEIEYISLQPYLNGQRPWYVIPATLKALGNISVLNNFRINRILFRYNSLSDWVKEPLKVIYYRLPQSIQKVLSKIVNVVRNKPRQHQIEDKLPNWKELLLNSHKVNYVNFQIQKFQPDVVILNYVFLANAFNSFLNQDLCKAPLFKGGWGDRNNNILKVILTHDVFYKRIASFQEIGVSVEGGSWNSEIEAEQLRKADVLLAIQKQDAEVLKQMAPQCQVITMPKAAKPYIQTTKQVPGRCLFVGTGADHNYQGLQWFLDNVWAKIIHLHPGSSLNICGSICDLIKNNYPNVRLLGIVEDLKPEYSAAEVCLIPLLAGSGLKIKTIEAMSYGRACVSTSVGIQGISEIADKSVLVADTADDFALSVNALLTNANQRKLMEEQAYRYVTENLSPQSVYQPFVDYIYQHINTTASMQHSR